ncbi:MAG: TetR/AcrR family transcriptional regulator [Nocardioides sp.]
MTADTTALDVPGTVSSQARFIDAALDLFVEHGYNGTSLQMIGDRLGVSKAAVTYHFKSKDELIGAVVAPAFQELTDLLEESQAIKRASARRTHALVGYVDYLIRQRRVASWLSRDVAALGHPVVYEPAQKLSGGIDAMLVVGPNDAVSQIWGSAITQALTGPILNQVDISDDDLREQLLAIGHHLIRGHQAAVRRGSGSR